MTLYDIIQTIESEAMAQPTINMIVENDPYKLDAEPSAEYALFAFRQTEHTANTDYTTITYGFEFFYIDRLTNDMRNQVEIQSVGLQTLDNIVRNLVDKGLYIEEYRFTPFYQKFVDECSGMMCALNIIAPITSLCAEVNEEKTTTII